MSGSNKDYFTEMVKLLIGLGIVAVVIVFAIRMLAGAFSSEEIMDADAVAKRLMSSERVVLVGGEKPKQETKQETKSAEKTDNMAASTSESKKMPAQEASQSVAIDAEGLYKAKCLACHAAGAGGAPILGNKDQWASRIEKGMDAIMDTALNGSKTNPMMQAKGGAVDLSDAEVKAIVEFMVSSSK